MTDVQTRIALGADIAREFARLHVVAPRARLGVCAAILGVPVASVAALDYAQADKVAVALAGCGTPGELVGLKARLERETDVTAIILRGDARRLPLPDACVDLIVTSPPYFSLRSYTDGGVHYGGQIGSEATPQEYVAALVECTAEWARVLKPSGSMFVNLGDKYAGVGGSNGHGWCIESDSTRERRAAVRVPLHKGRKSIAAPKSLMQLPARYAIAATDQLGLILRRDIIWAKPNGLPESVTDRCRSSHEYVFHLTRQPRYYAAVDEIREPHAQRTWEQHRIDVRAGLGMSIRLGRGGAPGEGRRERSSTPEPNPLGKLPGSVWNIPSQPLTVPPGLGVDHFAAFPMELPRRCVLGWSPGGVCVACGEGRRPVSDVERTPRPTSGPLRGGRNQTVRDGHPGVSENFMRLTTITGYACACPTPDAPTRPSVVLDPFGGTGTTALVASVYGRTGISIDHSADYCRLAAWRTTDPGERCRVIGAPKPPPVHDGQEPLFDLAT